MWTHGQHSSICETPIKIMQMVGTSMGIHAALLTIAKLMVDHFILGEENEYKDD